MPAPSARRRAPVWLAVAAVVGACSHAASPPRGMERSSPGGAPGQTAPDGGPARLQAQDVLLTAATRTLDAKTSRFTMQVVMPGAAGAGGDTTTISGDGVFDYAARRGSFNFTLPARDGPSQGQIQAISEGSIVYEKFPAQLTQQLGGKPWVKIDVQSLSRRLGLDLSTLGQYQSGDPSQAVRFFKGASKDTTAVGTETVRGDPATHYRTTIDLNRAAQVTSGDEQAALQRLAQLYGNQPIPADVWVDGQNRMRRLSYTLDLSKVDTSKLPQAAGSPAARPAGTASFSMELFDFGVAAAIPGPPAPDQVTDYADLLKRAGR